jgi:transitional endoplasmic reticulum ATPase
VFVEVPCVKWSDVGGLDDVKQELREAVEWPLKYPQVFEQAGTHPPKGILLHGKPGTGKTLLAKAVATESGVNFISIKGPQLVNRYVGESERGVRETFRKAKQAAPVILFFDEIESLIPRRGSSGDGQVTERVISQFLTEMDGIEELKGVVVLAATNRPDLIDPAMLRSGRFDLLFELPTPDESTREQIFAIHTKNKPLGKDVDIKRLAKQMDGSTGSDIEGVCRRAAMLAVREHIHHKAALVISSRHFEEALAALKRQSMNQGESHSLDNE